MKAVFYFVLLPASAVASVVLRTLVCYASRGITPRLSVPESWVVVDACSVTVVTVVVAIILDVREK